MKPSLLDIIFHPPAPQKHKIITNQIISESNKVKIQLKSIELFIT